MKLTCCSPRWMDGLALWFIAYTCCAPAWGSFCSVLSNIFPGWSCNGKQISPPDLSSEKKLFFLKNKQTGNKVSQRITRCLIWEQNSGFRKERTRSQPKERVEPFFKNKRGSMNAFGLSVSSMKSNGILLPCWSILFCNRTAGNRWRRGDAWTKPEHFRLKGVGVFCGAPG